MTNLCAEPKILRGQIRKCMLPSQYQLDDSLDVLVVLYPSINGEEDVSIVAAVDIYQTKEEALAVATDRDLIASVLECDGADLYAVVKGDMLASVWTEQLGVTSGSIDPDITLLSAHLHQMPTEEIGDYVKEQKIPAIIGERDLLAEGEKSPLYENRMDQTRTLAKLAWDCAFRN